MLPARLATSLGVWIGQYAKPNAAEMGYITDTSKIPGINIPKDMPTMSEADLIKSEAERDAALQSLNPPKEPYYFKPLQDQFNPLTGQLEEYSDSGYFDKLNEQFNPETGQLEEWNTDHPFTDAMSQEQMDDFLQEQLQDKSIWDDSNFDWTKLLKNLQKLLSGIGSGDEQNIPGYTTSWWGGRRPLGGGVYEESPYDENGRIKSLKKSNPGAGEFDAGQFGVNPFLGMSLEDIVRLSALQG